MSKTSYENDITLDDDSLEEVSEEAIRDAYEKMTDLEDELDDHDLIFALSLAEARENYINRAEIFAKQKEEDIYTTSILMGMKETLAKSEGSDAVREGTICRTTNMKNKSGLVQIKHGEWFVSEKCQDLKGLVRKDSFTLVVLNKILAVIRMYLRRCIDVIETRTAYKPVDLLNIYFKYLTKLSDDYIAMYYIGYKSINPYIRKKGTAKEEHDLYGVLRKHELPPFTDVFKLCTNILRDKNEELPSERIKRNLALGTEYCNKLKSLLLEVFSEDLIESEITDGDCRFDFRVPDYGRIYEVKTSVGTFNYESSREQYKKYVEYITEREKDFTLRYVFNNAILVNVSSNEIYSTRYIWGPELGILIRTFGEFCEDFEEVPSLIPYL
jgi:hypothetical protein